MNNHDFQKLREIGYGIPPLCGYCVHSKFNTEWGICDRYRFDGRCVRIHVTGTCRKGFEADPLRLEKTELGAYLEFFNGKSRQAHGS